MIKVKVFHIVSPGDQSVGWFPANFKLEGDFIFDDEGDLSHFRKNLKDAFEIVADDAYVETYEEREAQLKVEDEMFNDQA